MNRNAISLWVLGGIGFIFLLSLGLHLFSPTRQTKVVFTFPNESGKGLVNEVRGMHLGLDKEENARVLVKEILLGPAHPQYFRLFPAESTLRSAISHGDTLYVDLKVNALTHDQDAPLPLRQKLSILKNTILLNVFGYSKVDFSFQGQPVLDKYR